MLAVLAATSIIGISIGLVGIGGIFLIPLLVWYGLPLETSIGTSLVTFTIVGIIGTIAYTMHGAIDWRAALLTSGGSLVSGAFGAKLSTMLPDRIVTACFAAFLLLTGLFALFGRKLFTRTASRPLTATTLVLCGVVAGIGSGLTGVGGAAVLIPLLLLLGVSPAIAVAVSQPNSIFASASGAAGHIVFGHVDFHLAGYLAVFCGLGVVAGAIIYRRVSGERLRTLVGIAVLCLGVWLIGKLLLAGEAL